MRITVIFFVILTATFVLPATDAVAKDEIYRWVDENGVVHFGSRAPAQTDAKQISIRQNRDGNTQPSSEPAPADISQQEEPQVSYAQRRRDERAKKRIEAAEKDKLTAAECESNRKIIAELEPATRVMVQQEDGSVIRMDDNDRLEMLAEAKAYVTENCNTQP